MYMYCLPIYIHFLLGMVIGDWEVVFFINNQLKSITKFYIVFCTQQAIMWMRIHVVLMNIHKNGIINKGSSNKSVIVITLIYALPIVSNDKVNEILISLIF
jgi:hypothetical protein